MPRSKFDPSKMRKKTTVKQENRCKICEKTILGSKYKFRQHLYQHKAVESRFKCEYCIKEYFRSDEYSKHLQSHTGRKDPKIYTCDHCDRSFIEKRNLIIHLKIHDDHPSSQYKCVACGMSYCEERLLKYHIRKTHYNLQRNDTSHFRKELNETWVERVKESEICVQLTKVNSNVITIKKCGTVKIEKEEKTDVNDEKARFKEYIASIFAETDKSQYSKATCDYCKKEMLKKSLLSHIRERHLKLRKFNCTECGKAFSRHYQMVGHACGQLRKQRKVKGN